MQFNTGIANASLVQSPLDHLEGGHFLRYEQYRLAIGNRRRDDISNGLRFASTRRSLDHQVTASAHIVHGQRLRTVAIDDMQQLGRRNIIVQVSVFWNG
ncbi:hypothetical protein D3C72_1708880 [compost metagenome]